MVYDWAESDPVFELDEPMHPIRLLFIIIVSFVCFVEAKSILNEFYQEIVTSWRVSPPDKSLDGKIQGQDDIISLASQDCVNLRTDQPVKEIEKLQLTNYFIYKDTDPNMSTLCSLEIHYNNNQLHLVSEILLDCGFSNSLEGCDTGLRSNDRMKFPSSNLKDTVFLKSVISIKKVKFFFNIDITPRSMSFPKDLPLMKYEVPTSKCTSSCFCQMACHYSTTLILPATTTFIYFYFNPYFKTSKIHQKAINNHVLRAIRQLPSAPGGKWTVVSCKTTKREQCDTLSKALEKRFRRKAKQ